MKKIMLSLMFMPVMVLAADLQDAVRDVAASKMSMQARIYEQNVDVVYVGTQASCDAVSIMWPRQRIENFRVCNGDVHPRNTVSPAWEENVGRPTLLSVVKNAIRYGRANQRDDNGYLVSARALSAVSHDCKTIEVIVSYDEDLVDRAVREICEK